MSGTLYLVPTPIGNLGDISPRAAQVLGEVDFIAAEDTRVTLRLLSHLDIKKPLLSYHEHNKGPSGRGILQKLQAGESCALVTDAGTPAISDPGEDLVRLCGEAGITVTAIPGPCAAITALAVSGLPTGRFTFEGFLSVNKKSRREHLRSLSGETRSMIFYEAPHKLLPTLEDLESAFGPDRKITLCRELTKLHEEILRTTLSGALQHYAELSPRGEYVLILAGLTEKEKQEAEIPDLAECLRRVALLREEGARLKDAVKTVSADTGFPKNQLYEAALKSESEEA